MADCPRPTREAWWCGVDCESGFRANAVPPNLDVDPCKWVEVGHSMETAVSTSSQDKQADASTERDSCLADDAQDGWVRCRPPVR